MGQFHQHGDDLRQPRGHRHRCYLDRQVVGVTVNDQAAQAVPLAKDQPRRPFRIVVAEVGPELQRRFKPPPPEAVVQLLLGVPCVQADLDAAATVEDPACDERPFVGDQLHHVAIGRVAFDAVDGRIEDPGVATVERAGLARFEDNLSHSRLSLVGAKLLSITHEGGRGKPPGELCVARFSGGKSCRTRRTAGIGKLPTANYAFFPSRQGPAETIMAQRLA